MTPDLCRHGPKPGCHEAKAFSMLDTLNKKLVKVGQVGMKGGSSLVNRLVNNFLFRVEAEALAQFSLEAEFSFGPCLDPALTW